MLKSWLHCICAALGINARKKTAKPKEIPRLTLLGLHRHGLCGGISICRYCADTNARTG